MDCPIRHRAVCALCEPAELAHLERIKSYRDLDAGQTVFRPGEPLDHVASLVSGVATLSRTLEDGRRQTVGLLFPSDFIGRPGRMRHAFEVRAVTALTLCRFERPAFEALIAATPNIAKRLLEMSLDELDAARDWAVVLGRMTAKEKVASFFLMLARRYGNAEPGGGASAHLPFTREAIADHLGLTLETASRQVSALKRAGLIETQGRSQIRLPDLARLAKLAGGVGAPGKAVDRSH